MTADMYISRNDEMNAAATIVKQLHGNMLSCWTNFLLEDGEKPWRESDAEFENADADPNQVMQWCAFLERKGDKALYR